MFNCLHMLGRVAALSSEPDSSSSSARGMGRGGIEGQGTLRETPRVRQPPGARVQEREVVGRGRIRRVQPAGRLQRGDGFGGAAEPLEGEAEALVGGRHLRGAAQRVLQEARPPSPDRPAGARGPRGRGRSARRCPPAPAWTRPRRGPRRAGRGPSARAPGRARSRPRTRWRRGRARGGRRRRRAAAGAAGPGRARGAPRPVPAPRPAISRSARRRGRGGRHPATPGRRGSAACPGSRWMGTVRSRSARASSCRPSTIRCTSRSVRSLASPSSMANGQKATDRGERGRHRDAPGPRRPALGQRTQRPGQGASGRHAQRDEQRQAVPGRDEEHGQGKRVGGDERRPGRGTRGAPPRAARRTRRYRRGTRSHGPTMSTRSSVGSSRDQ